MVHSPDGHNNQAWAKPNSGARDSIPSSHTRGRNPSTWAIFHCLPRGISRDLDCSKAARTPTCPQILDSSITDTDLTHSQNSAPRCVSGGRVFTGSGKNPLRGVGEHTGRTRRCAGSTMNKDKDGCQEREHAENCKLHEGF